MMFCAITAMIIARFGCRISPFCSRNKLIFLVSRMEVFGRRRRDMEASHLRRLQKQCVLPSDPNNCMRKHPIHKALRLGIQISITKIFGIRWIFNAFPRSSRVCVVEVCLTISSKPAPMQQVTVGSTDDPTRGHREREGKRPLLWGTSSVRRSRGTFAIIKHESGGRKANSHPTLELAMETKARQPKSIRQGRQNPTLR
ncbi:hypothetical protein MUK42_33356 [Musa troglodytarum]|uniref:Uncharacterized protein n=1 Tax=Musa troglodytarum TaxID=320322 RepID=A0A9E7JTG8_9LILI|nr:hypothetical protein MUK42_33356 [Musa troglodytarum]